MSPAHFPEKYTEKITLVIYCQLCIDCESNKHILKIKKKKKIEVLFTLVATESLDLTPSQTSVPLETQTSSKFTGLNVLYLSNFSSKIITQLLAACLKTGLHSVPIWEMAKLHTLALNFGGWPFSITITKYLRQKSDHSNERVYRKPIDGRLKTLLNKESGSCLQQNTPRLWMFF